MPAIVHRPTLIGLLQAAAALTVVFSIATYADALHRYLELFSHFRLQYLIASLLLALMFIALRNRAWAGLMLLTTAINVWPIAAWYVTDDRTDGTAVTEIKILQVNLWSGNTDTPTLVDLIGTEEPDIVFLQEVTDTWVAAMEELEAVYPHRLTIPRNDNFGVAVYARTPLVDVEALGSPPFGFPSLVVRQEIGDATVTFAATHPMPPLGAAGFAARNEQLASIADVIDAAAGPTILVGDLNTTMWAHHYERLEDQTGLANARAGFGVVPTWPTYLPRFARIPIDHCLVSQHFAVRDVRTGPNVGSDHLPLIVELALLE